MNTQPIRRTKSLGPIKAKHNDYPLRVRHLFTILLPGLLSILLPLGYAIDRQWYASANFGPAAAQTWPRPWYGLALATGLIFLALGVYRLLLAGWRISVHAQGLRVKRPPFPARTLHWNELSGIAYGVSQARFLGIPLRRLQHAEIFPNTGKPIRLTSSSTALTQVVTHLKAALYPRLTTPYLEMFQSGQWLFFGPAAIHMDGLRIGKRYAAWQDIERVSVRQGYLVVELRTEPGRTPRNTPAVKVLSKVPVARIPNFELLLDLIPKETLA